MLLIRFIKKIICYYFFKLRFINKHVKLEYNTNLKRTILERFNSFGSNSDVSYSNIGFGSYCGLNCMLSNVKIGRFCSLGNNIKVVSSIHPLKTFVSTSPIFYSLSKQANVTFVTKQKFEEYTLLQNSQYSVEIGNDVWIGDDVTILGGIKIGDGAIIATRAVVTRDIEPYAIVAGIPAKVIRMRFNESQISELLNFKWWEKIDFSKEHAELFDNVENFISFIQYESKK